MTENFWNDKDLVSLCLLGLIVVGGFIGAAVTTFRDYVKTGRWC